MEAVDFGVKCGIFDVFWKLTRWISKLLEEFTLTRRQKKGWAIAGIVAGIFIVVAALANVALSGIDRQVQTYLESVAGDTLGVPVDIQSLSLNEFGGDLEIENLTLQNPPGFATPYLMKIDRLDLQLQPRTLFSDVVAIDDFSVNNVDINIEQNLAGNNVLKVVDRLNSEGNTRASVGDRGGLETAETGKKLKLNFRAIAVRNTRVNLVLSSFGLVADPVHFKLPDLRLTDVSSDELQAVLTEELIASFVGDLFEGIVRDGGEQIPDLLEDAIAPQLN